MDMSKILKEAIKPSKYCKYCHEVCVDGIRAWEGACSEQCLEMWRLQKRNQVAERNKLRLREFQPRWLRLRFEVLQRDNFRCVYCGATPQDEIKLQVDHVIPRAKGGTNDIDNLVTACEWCNNGKGDVLLHEYRR